MNFNDDAKKYCDKLGYSNEVYLKAHELYLIFEEKNNYKKNEELIIFSLYFGGLLVGERRVQKEIAKTFNISTIKLRKIYRGYASIYNKKYGDVPQ